MIFKPRFVFRANAFGIGGQIREPYMPYFEVQAASSLPTVGGLSRAEAQGRGFSDLLTFGFARTSATGGVRRENDPRNNTTSVEAELLDLKVEGRFFAERTLMALKSYQQHGDDETHVPLGETAIQGVTIDGCQVDVLIDPEAFVTAPTKKAIQRNFREDIKWRKRFGPQFFRPPDGKVPENQPVENKSGLIFATIVKEIIVHHSPQCRKHGGRLVVEDNTISVPNFGTVYFGELIIDEHYRRLAGIRLELGSPMRADIEICGIDSDGSGAP